jgi:hypothetical protein
MNMASRLTELTEFLKARLFSQVGICALLLASLLWVGAVPGIDIPTGQAQVGPQPPPPKPDSQVTKALTKLLSKKKKTEGDSASEAGTKAEEGSAPSSGKAASHQATPAAEEEESRHPPLLTQPPLTNAKVDDPQIDEANPPKLDHPKLDDPNNPLGFTEAEIRLKKYITLIDAHRYAEARAGLLQLRQWLIDLTEAHIGLYKTLNQVPSARGQAELEKELALQFAQLRDRAMVEAARLHIAEKDYTRAVKELTDVVKSQPRTRLGLHSYELLQEIGFTEKLQLTQ